MRRCLIPSRHVTGSCDGWRPHSEAIHCTASFYPRSCLTLHFSAFLYLFDPTRPTAHQLKAVMPSKDDEEFLLRSIAGPSTHRQSNSLSRAGSRPVSASGSRRSSGEMVRKARLSDDGLRVGSSRLNKSMRMDDDGDTNVCEWISLRGARSGLTASVQWAGRG